VGKVRQRRALGQLAEGDLASLRALGAERVALFLRPAAFVFLEGGEYVFICIRGEMPRDEIGIAGNTRFGRAGRRFGQDARNPAGPVVYPSLYLFQLFAAKVMR